MSFPSFGSDRFSDPARNKLLLQALALRQHNPRNLGEGLSAIGAAIGGGLMRRRINKAETEGKNLFNKQFSELFSGERRRPQNMNDKSSLGASGDFNTRLAQSESGGRHSAQNSEGFVGKYQFGQERLDDFNRASGTRYTTAQLLKDPALQEQVQAWHVNDIDNFAKSKNLNRFIGQNINGATITQDAIRSVAHLGGKEGLRKFLETGGRYNPSDSNGTSLLDYATRFGGGNAQPVNSEGTPQTASIGGGQQSSQQNDGMLAQLLGNPHATPGQKAMLQALMRQQFQNSDPLRQLQMQKAQIELRNLQDPQQQPIKGVSVGGNLVNPLTGQVIYQGNSGESGPPERGLNPQYGVGPDGNPVLLQLGKDGTAVQTQLPDGVQLSKEPIKLDAGTHFVLLDPITRQPVGNIPKDIAGEAGQREAGKRQAGVSFDLPKTENTANDALKAVDELLTHPGLESSVGTFQGRIPDGIAGVLNSDVADFRSRLDQAKGKTFLQGFQSLKGGGPVTEVEGLKAEQAFARMNQAVNEDDFRRALMDYRQAIVNGQNAMRQQAGAPVSQEPGADGADIDALIQKYGG